MAAVRAELKFRDGLRQKVHVRVDNDLSSVIAAVHELHLNVSSILNQLVEREKTGVCAEEEEEEDDEGSDEEDTEPEDPPKYESQPPAKRSKT
ncbi:hypothetical protein D9C73_027627 [Collichthys lucidus]|uniref:EKC/KEOPS complex subunit n=1 Tax=Collichthys lucidus TaxID=240159 RepID=A0A4U5TU56_COLLU|nr:hypothetical protein D9C73_027607 [Collichthys lucidus]TKS65096.1 hypothetical protein D9C73_027627 [Collichthys lucidus]